MIELLAEIAVVASDEFVPPDDWRSQIALPVGIIFLYGGIFMLLRSNLGTRRAYLVQATALFGFVFFLSLFWAFGAPGTPAFSGPQNLPGQPIDYYQPKWVPFAADSVIAGEPEFDVVGDYPDAWSTTPPAGLDSEAIEEGIDDIVAFFSSEEGGQRVGPTAVAFTEDTPLRFAESADGRALMAVVVADADVLGEVTDPDSALLLFALFDEGFLLLPSLVFVVIAGLGFLLHLVLLGWDERQERRELEEDLGTAEPAPESEPERVPAGV